MAITTEITRPDVIELTGVSKLFTVRKDSSLKERVVTLGRVGRRMKTDFWALSDVDLTIYAGDTIGLIGHNGSGKSTLLKVIGGILQPTDGTVRQRGRVAALLELGAGFHPDLTGRENVYLNASVLGLSREETEAAFPEILEFAGIGNFIDTQVKFYSSGMYVRLAFAVAVHTNPDILLVDEVLAVGDEQFQRKCLDKIKSFQDEGRTIIIVSHALDQVESLCNRAVLMDEGRIAFDGLPPRAIKRFRQLLSGTTGVGEERPAPLSRAAEITRLEVLDPSDYSPLRTVPAGKSFIVRCHVEMDHPLKRWDVGFSIDTAMGNMAVASSTDQIAQTLAPLSRTRFVDFLVESANFNPGTYFVSANLVGVSEATADALVHGAKFTVPGTSSTLGGVHCHVKLLQ